MKYKMNNGVSLTDDGVIDAKTGLRYKDPFIHDAFVDPKKLNYDVSDSNKFLDEKMRLYLKNGVICETGEVSIWDFNRKFMILQLVLICIIPLAALTILKFIVLGQNFSEMIWLPNFLIMWVMVVLIHEIGHALTYWTFQNKYNGYFKITPINITFSFNPLMLNNRKIILVNVAGLVCAVLFLGLLWTLIPKSHDIVAICFIIQISCFILSSDFINIIYAIKR